MMVSPFDSFVQRNDALEVNPTKAGTDYAITSHGSDVYWAVAAVMSFSTIIFFGLSFTKPRSDRLFHYITGSITMVAAIAYFTMASNLGYTGIAVEFRPSFENQTREIFYVRYIDWFITTPLLLLDLCLTAGLPWPTVLLTLLLDEVMIITGLVGALVRSSYKWGYFVFAMAALFAVTWNLVWTARKHAMALGKDIHTAFLICGIWTLFLWFLYPVAWGVSEGANVIHPDSEAIFYSVLDVLAKPVFGAVLLYFHRNIDPNRLGMSIRDYEDYPVGHDREKSAGYRGGVDHGATGPATIPSTADNTAIPTIVGATYVDANPNPSIRSGNPSRHVSPAPPVTSVDPEPGRLVADAPCVQIHPNNSHRTHATENGSL